VILLLAVIIWVSVYTFTQHWPVFGLPCLYPVKLIYSWVSVKKRPPRFGVSKEIQSNGQITNTLMIYKQYKFGGGYTDIDYFPTYFNYVTVGYIRFIGPS
jgi:hypothetical protein